MKVTIILLSFLATFLLAQAKKEPRVAPYIYTGMDLVSLKQKYGLNAVTLAFILAGNGCTPAWDGQTNLADNDVISKIKAFRSAGGQVIVSSGGAAGHYLENGCNSASALAGAYKKVLDEVGSTHLDLDMEQNIDATKVMQAVAQLQKQESAVTFSLTIGVDNNGITEQGVNILNQANKQGVVVDTVNIMAMDYQANKAWGSAVQDCAEATHKQLKKIWPEKSDAEIYSIIGITPMIGRNDEGRAFTLDDAEKTVQYAKSKGIGHLAFWALGRDNGKCPNEQGDPSDECSGISQDDHAFTKIFVKFQ